ncbi:unnamed protein product [Rotaria sordida]|uniref:Uncharacterized protein n=1 Tax=Rotaria sordida TaxID=392033 RepID=A0A814H9A6_9BILA|nr:unnamed protein product [Rotaria sordida]
MITSNMTLREKLIKCGICQKQFEDPRILPCSHTYCLRCIKQIASNHPEHFECPQHDGAIVPKNSIDKLKVNRTMRNIIESLNFNSGLIPCTNCNSLTSEYWCNNCTNNYCTQCSRQIHELRAFQNHQSIPLKEKSIELISCEKHQDEKLKHWCLKCDTSICSDCLLYEHKDHPYILLRKAAKDLETKVNIDLFNIELSLNNNINQTDTSITTIKNEYESKKLMINDSMNFLQRIINEHEKEILENIQNIDENNNKLMEDFKIRLQNELQQLDIQKTTLEILLSSNDPMKLMHARQDFFDYINRRNRILQGLQLPTKHIYYIEGIDQIQNVRHNILQCGQLIDILKQPDETIAYYNPQLEKLIIDNQTQQEWNFERKIMIDEDMKIIADALKNNTRLIKLHLPQCQINDQGAKYLADVLQHNNTLISLYLYKNHISNYGVRFLADALIQNNTLTTLDLSQNYINDQGVRYLANMLQQNRTLITLHLSQNQIGDQGAQYLANVLQQNTTLKTIHLSQNLIGDQGAQHLADALTYDNTALTTLNLYWNDIGDIGAQSIAHALENNRTLTTLYLSRNRITNNGVQYFADALRRNITLSTLSLHENRIDQQIQNHMINILKTNTRVTIHW